MMREYLVGPATHWSTLDHLRRGDPPTILALTAALSWSWQAAHGLKRPNSPLSTLAPLTVPVIRIVVPGPPADSGTSLAVNDGETQMAANLSMAQTEMVPETSGRRSVGRTTQLCCRVIYGVGMVGRQTR